MKTILLTGGIGYIGSHTCVELISGGYQVIILDNESNASPGILNKIKHITGILPIYYKADLRDISEISKVFQNHSIDGVIHFAGAKAVSESCENPFYYYQNNILGSINLFEVMQKFEVKNIIFSSSASVYGKSGFSPFTETHAAGETSNPYATTKYIIERLLKDLYAQCSFNVMILRYFNPVGAHESGLIGEHAEQKLGNILPFLLRVANGQQESIHVYGNDYDTPDGTGIRDYIHVVDLAKGHIAALEYMNQSHGYQTINLGTGSGTSVMQLIKIVEQVTGQEIPYEITERREIDIPEAYCNTSKAKTLLGWKAYKTVAESVKDSWNFIKTNTGK